MNTLNSKEAKTSFDTDRLTKYCCALANEGGGHMVLGVTDKPPRVIVGSKAFPNLEDIKSKLIQRLQIRIDAAEALLKPNDYLAHSRILLERGRVLMQQGDMETFHAFFLAVL